MSPTSSTSTILIISALDLLMAALAAALGLLVIFSAAGASNTSAGTRGQASFARWTQLEFQFESKYSTVTCTQISKSRSPTTLLSTASGSFTVFRIEDSIGMVVSCTAQAVVGTKVIVRTPSNSIPKESDCAGELFVTYVEKTDATTSLTTECTRG